MEAAASVVPEGAIAAAIVDMSAAPGSDDGSRATEVAAATAGAGAAWLVALADCFALFFAMAAISVAGATLFAELEGAWLRRALFLAMAAAFFSAIAVAATLVLVQGVTS